MRKSQKPFVISLRNTHPKPLNISISAGNIRLYTASNAAGPNAGFQRLRAGGLRHIHKQFLGREPTAQARSGTGSRDDRERFKLCYENYQHKEYQNNILVTVDGSAFHTKPTFHKVNQPHTIISPGKVNKRGIYSVCGATCMEKDYLLNDIDNIVPDRGDYIKIDSVGAYTIVLTPTFIHPVPPILVRQDDNYKQIRRRQNFADMFGCFFFE